MLLTNDLAALISFACEAVFWSVNATLFIVSLIILRYHTFRDHLNNPVLYLNCLIFVCCTTHFALEFNHFYTTLNAIGVTNYANETSQLVAADFLISFTDLLGDLVLIYRCWILWNKNYYIVILPLFSAVSGFACIIAVIDILLATNPNSPAPPAALVPLGLAGLSSLFVQIPRTVPDAPFPIHQGAVHRAMMLVIESGALYLLFQLIFVVLFAIPSPAEAIIAVMAVQIYGIAPTLIIIRVGLGVSSEHSTGTDTSTGIKWATYHEEGVGTMETPYTDNVATHADVEAMKE